MPLDLLPLPHALALLSLVGFLGWWRQQRAFRQLASRLLEMEARSRTLQKELAALLACSRGLGERIEQQQVRLRVVRSGQRTPAPVAPIAAGEAQYRSARLLIERGASTMEVARNCGLSQGEVELLARLAAQSAAG
jgi:hypothetical protein